MRVYTMIRPTHLEDFPAEFKRTGQLYPEVSIIRNEAYFLDECPDGFGGFSPIAFLVERSR